MHSRTADILLRVLEVDGLRDRAGTKARSTFDRRSRVLLETWFRVARVFPARAPPRPSAGDSWRS
ncbi:MAG TPA: hypothetical protein DEP35_24290 [Deltaproteobacteria bacterium]|nr:hypothetical protein [Deltaproteobacteria bacterium]